MEDSLFKKCTKCKEEKSLCNFVRSSQRKDGLYPYCKLCKNINRNESYKRNKQKSKDYYLKNHKKIKDYRDLRYSIKNKEISKKSREYEINNYNKISVKKKEYYLKNKEYKKQKMKDYAKNNLKKFRSYNAKRNSAKLKRTPKWADLKAIQEFYKNCPEGYEVDHIIPLRGKNVSGFHVIENLQYLTKEENCRKGNRYVG